MALELIKWTDLYSVKNSVIDAQHKKLVELINELFRLISKKENREKMENIINSLIEYTQYHFITEEELFNKYGYPEIEKHKEEHQDFVNQVLQFKTDYSEGKVQIKFDVFSFLKDWLLKHIIGSDKKYMQYFKKAKVKEYFV